MLFTLLPIFTFWITASVCYYGNFDSSENMYNIKNKVSVRGTVIRMIQLHFLQICTSAPMEMGYSLFDVTVSGIRWYFVVFGCIWIDFVEFVLHRTYHKIPFLYQHLHKTHHEIIHSWSFGALYNSVGESIVTGATILLSMVLIFKFTLAEFSVAVSICTFFTVLDHCAFFDNRWWKSKQNHHKIHHENNRFNFQQPIFTYLDSLTNNKFKHF